MKTKLYLTALAHLLIISMYAQQQPSTTTAKTDLPDGISSDWFEKASSFIHDMEYDFYPTTRNNQFRVANHKNQTGFFIDPAGFTVHNIQYKTSDPSWSVRFQLEPQQDSRNKSIVVIKKKNGLVYSNPKMDVEYVNQPEGLRQNFIVHERGTSENLSIQMELETELEAVIQNDNKLLFHKAGNNKDIKLIYDDLKVWDANHTMLAAKMQLDKARKTLSIIVDDRNAVYPVTVDPLNRTPEWTTSADGILPGLLTNLQLQVQTLYGFTVAGLGDLNGDGYDDVGVGAPGMADVITGTGSLSGVGAVFIYLGSATGLPVMPSKVLQPTTAVSGALFGFSMDAGDITGDGKNDIVIGAPLDRYQTTAAGVVPTNVNVTAGKVYFYRSEDLFAAANPTPFLQIRLQGTSFFSTGILGVLGSNVASNPLFGFSVGVTEDLNGDSKADLVIGSPKYIGIQLLSVQSGAAFVYYSSDLATTAPLQLDVPTPTLLGIPSLPIGNTSGLLFGFSVDGLGDYNNDGRPDVVVGAPAGVDLSTLGGIFTGQFLGGSAYVYYGKNNGTGLNNDIKVKLHGSPTGLLSNAANLFGYEVRGVRNVNGARNGNILIGAPVGSVLSNVLNGLRVKAGQVHVFKRKATNPPPSTPVTSDQVLSSPRASSILSILAGQTINVSMLYGSSIDNMLDVNCDGFGDIIVGEPLSTAVPLIGADVVGGAAYIYLGTADGSYQPAPFWDLTTVVSPLLGVNTTALLGYSVAGARYVRGRAQGVRSLVGGPSNSLDFGIGLLNLGNTLGVLFDFVFDNNGLGKAYAFGHQNCNITLPALLLEFKGQKNSKMVDLNWTTAMEENVSHFELQHSTDGINFQAIAIVFARGEQQNQYLYPDKHPFTGNNYYRLKIIDNDGRFSFSNVVMIRFDDKLPGEVIVAPNPVAADINIRLTGLDNGTYQMELRNTVGQLLQAKTIKVSQFNQTETMKRSAGMAAGVYWLNIYNKTNNKLVSTIRVFMEQ